MTLKQQADKALEAIQADPQLLEWARYSIRYNDGPFDQANDFANKLRSHAFVHPDLGSIQALALALAAINLLDTRGEKSDDIPPDPEGMNDARANWAQVAIDAFGAVTHMDTAGEDSETMLGDLLCDQMHWCDRNGVDFDQLLARARMNYEEGTKDETA